MFYRPRSQKVEGMFTELLEGAAETIWIFFVFQESYINFVKVWFKVAEVQGIGIRFGYLSLTMS